MFPDANEVTRVIRKVAAAEIMSRFQNLKGNDIARKKGPSDLVTIADVEAERCLSGALPDIVPGSRTVGEESAEYDPELLRLLKGDAPVWLIDPLDGTSNFVRGIPCFAVIVALCLDGSTLAGWIHDPVTDMTVWAFSGEGAWITDNCHTRRLCPLQTMNVSEMTGSLGYRLAIKIRQSRNKKIESLPKKIIRYGSTGREYIDLGRGILHFAHYTRLKPWDHAAGALIHREAGGFSQILATQTPYRPDSGITEATLLLAPDESSWHTLKQILD